MLWYTYDLRCSDLSTRMYMYWSWVKWGQKILREERFVEYFGLLI